MNRYGIIIFISAVLGTAIYLRWHGHITTIFVITPTYARPTQEPELVRLCTVLSKVRNIHWIVIEDAKNRSLYEVFA